MKNILKNIDSNIIGKNEIYITTSVFGFILGLLLFVFYTPNYYKLNAPVEFEIPPGTTLTAVIDSLYRQELIPSTSLMHASAFLYGAERKVKAGKYRIPNGLSYFGLIELLLAGSTANQKLVTIPEGIWQHNLAGLFSTQMKLDSLKFLKLSSDKSLLAKMGITVNSAEGYLLPETYYLYEDSDEAEIIIRLKNEMDKIFNSDSVERRMEEINMTKHQILTLASIIEGESNIISEFKKISGVYHNRLKKNMLLQADPTIQYLKRFSKRKNRILYKDLEIDSPYNTYLYAGLPPAPINNPGKDAVLAALFPEEHNYYYFVADGSGGHVFARTLGEHNRNVRNYRIWRNSK